jgi:lipoprotein NlpI
MIEGHTAEAAELFRKSVATEESGFVEYLSSQMELKRLEPSAPPQARR